MAKQKKIVKKVKKAANSAAKKVKKTVNKAVKKVKKGCKCSLLDRFKF